MSAPIAPYPAALPAGGGRGAFGYYGGRAQSLHRVASLRHRLPRLLHDRPHLMPELPADR